MDIIRTRTFFFYLLSALVVFIVGLVIVSTFFLTKSESNADTSTLHPLFLNGEKVSVTIVDTPESREKGLSARSQLDSDEGMLFVFPQDGKYGFWMKDTKFPIDIFWISRDKEIVDMDKNISPATFPDVFVPDVPIRYVLELPAGFADRKNIQIGHKVVF